MRTQSIILTALTLGALTLAGQAHAATPAWTGVWQGTIGKANVRVCLQSDEYHQFGIYYYQRYLTPIHLDPVKGTQPSWREDGTTPTNGPVWRLTSVKAGHLQGEWTGGGKTLPIDLTHVPLAKSLVDPDDDMPCGNAAFNLPRFTKPVFVTKPAELNGIAYTHVQVDIGKQFVNSGIETFQLKGTSPAIQRVNAALYESIPTRPETAVYLQCSSQALEQTGQDGDIYLIREPVLLSAGWLVMQENESSYCGGAHPNSSTGYETWDLRAGAEVNLYDWFTPAALTQTVTDKGTSNEYTTIAYTPAFRKLIIGAFPPPGEDECKEVIDTTEDWSPRLSAKGVVFTPDLVHAVQACGDDAVIPFAKLTPYLSAKGKAGIAAFTAEVRPAK